MTAMFSNAVAAMKKYTGNMDDEEEEDYEDIY
jgi:hypothetical protein